MSGNATIGALRVVLGLDSAEFTKGITAAQKELKRAGEQMQAIGGNFAATGAVLSAAITAPVLAFAASARAAAKESKEAFGQVETALKSMGGASQRTAAQLEDAAAKLQAMSTFDDDDILRKVTANMLTFGNVSGQAFDRAQRAAVDMATRLQMDLQPATMMVGKALNDPVKGIAALSRAGIQFTADQKAMIKSMAEVGNVAGAQEIMLAELERQFGGSAQALRDATPEAALIDQWREFQETVGAIAETVLPPLIAAAEGVLEAFNTLTPEMQTAVVTTAGFAAAVGPAVVALGALISAVGTVGVAFSAMSARVVAGTAAMNGAAGGARGLSIALGLVGGPIGALITAVGLASAGLLILQQRQSGAAEAQAEAAAIADSLTTATNAYQAAALAAATASGKARDSALKEAAALRETAIQAQAAAREKIKLAQATIAALNAENQRAIAADRYSARGDGAGTIKPTLNSPKIAAQQQLVTKATADLNAAIKSMADADRILNATIPTLGRAGVAAGEAAEKTGKAVKKTRDAAKEFDDKLKEVIERLQTDTERATRQAAEDIAVLREAFDRGKISAAEFHDQLQRMVEIKPGKGPETVEGLKKPWEDASEAWSEEVEEREREQAESLKRMGLNFKGFFQDWVTSGKADWKRLLLDMTNDWEGTIAAFKSIGGAIADLFGGKGGGLGKAFTEIFGGSSGGGAGGILSGIGALFSKTGPMAAIASAVAAAGGAISSSLTKAFGGDARQQSNANTWGSMFGLVGGLLGAVLGGKESNHGAIATLTDNGISLSGNKRNDETSKAATATAEAIQAAQAGLAALGISLGTTVRQIDIGTRDLTHIYLSNGQELRSAVGDPAAAAETGLKAVLQGATYTSDAQKALVDSMLAAGKGFDDIAAGLQSFAQAQLVPQTIADSIAKLVDPSGYETRALIADQQARRAEMQKQLEAGFLTAAQFASISEQLTKLEGLELGKAIEGLNDNQAASEAQARIQTARAALETAYRRSADVFNATAEKFRSLASSLQAFGKRLGDVLSGATGEGATAGAAAEFERLAALAQLSNADAMAQLEEAGDAYVAASEETAATLQEHLAVVARVKAAVEAAEATAIRQVNIAEQQLAALDAQVAGLLTVNDSVLSVADAIAELQAALAATETTGRKWGLNPEANKALASATGYAGDFGSGGWHAWIVQQDEATKAIARHILGAFGQTERIVGFAGGGSFRVGGSGGLDSKLMQMRLSPGEMVDVTTPGQATGLANEIRTLRSELLPAITAGNARLSDLERRIRGWDGLGLPEEREVA